MPNGQTSAIPPFPTTNGDKVCLEEYLKNIYIFAVENTEKNIKWYGDGALPNKRRARSMRFGAILFVALAGITPLVLAALPDNVVSANLVAQISYIFIGIAAFLIGVDKFFGYSASWMRYITTQIALETLLAKFRYDWAIESVKVCDKLDIGACNPLLVIVKDFAAAVQSKMEIETAEWATDLRNNLLDLEKKTAPSTSRIEPGPTKEDKPSEISGLTPSLPSPQPAGTDITWTAKAINPDNGIISYKFFLNDEEVTLWQPKDQWIWKIPAEKAGSSNKIEVRVIYGKLAGREGYDAKKSADFKVNA